ncbi:DUF2846 domain-containing protein [Variovorax soli]|uniref:DUF2846 domain-containing protein n=1 Tax=Variovorax soli TaxID=376815 RepID=UPI00083999D8|nr:DUF2846 domain-containing protein [Variovorax soli]
MFKKLEMTRALVLTCALAPLSVLAQLAPPQQASAPLATAPSATSPVHRQAFGEVYTPVGAASTKQAQVVVYRALSQAPVKADAKIYVDGKLHTALLPNGYSTFCVPAGEHSIAVLANGANKSQLVPSALSLEGGKTYFLKVREDAASSLMTVPQQEAQQQLQSSRAQLHVHSRASAVQPCAHASATH